MRLWPHAGGLTVAGNRDRFPASTPPAGRRWATLLVWVPLVWACAAESRVGSRAEARHAEGAADSGFAEVQRRGHLAMGVDQYTSTHRFQPLPDGGRIELQRDTADAAGRTRILEHMTAIVAAFRAGDFAIPGFVHARTVPGTAVMAARRKAIRYEVERLPRGAALRLTSHDSAAIAAIHEFLAFQSRDHRTGPGSEH